MKTKIIRISTYTLIYIFITIFYCCTENEIYLTDTHNKIVINGLISTDNKFGVNISKSVPVTDTTWVHENLLNTASVELYENGVYIDTLRNLDFVLVDGGIKITDNYVHDHAYPQCNKHYSLRVSAPGFEDVYSTIVIPSLVEIEKLDTTVLELEGNFEEWESKIHFICDIMFSDPGNEMNYYLVYIFSKVYKKDSFGNFYPGGELYHICFTSEDPVIEEKIADGTVNYGIAFSDKVINSKSYKLTIKINDNDIYMPDHDLGFYKVYKTVIYFKFYSITEDYYTYIQTLNKFTGNINNPFTDPVQVHTNIEGGLGILGAAAVSTDSLVFK